MSRAGFQEFPDAPGLDLPPARHLVDLLSRVEPISAPWSQFARALVTRGRLPAPEREMVILRVASRRSCDYILAGHRRIAAHCGLSADRLAQAAGNREPEPATLDAALISATDELLDGGRIPAGRRRELAHFLSEEDTIELTMLVGQYALISMLCETFELPPEG